MSSLDAEIDAFARRIERQISRNEARLARLPEFDGGRRETVSSTARSDELFL